MIDTILALALTVQKEPDAQIMCVLRDYAERYDWLVQVFQDWSFTFLSSFLFYEDYDEMEEETRDIYRAGMETFEGIVPEYHIELRERSTMVWDFHSLLLLCIHICVYGSEQQIQRIFCFLCHYTLFLRPVRSVVR